MNVRQKLFWNQAKTDWEVYEYLVAASPPKPVCHELHYLQMCTEKLAKAYFTVPPKSHAALVDFIYALRSNKKAIAPLGFADDAELSRWAHSVDPLVQTIERLSPDLARRFKTEINPEYPWPKGAEMIAPVDYSFQTEIFDLIDIQKKSGEQRFFDIFTKMVNTLDQWCQ